MTHKKGTPLKWPIPKPPNPPGGTFIQQPLDEEEGVPLFLVFPMCIVSFLLGLMCNLLH